jgi:hypothetical protein
MAALKTYSVLHRKIRNKTAYSYRFWVLVFAVLEEIFGPGPELLEEALARLA